MKFWSQEFIESLTLKPIQKHKDRPKSRSGTPDLAAMEQIPLCSAQIPAAPPSPHLPGAPTPSGCGGECACNAPPTTDALDPSGIEAMLTQMLRENDPQLSQESLQTLSEQVEWERLEHIVQLSQLGDGWNDEAAKESIESGLEQLLNQPMTRRTATMMIASGLLAGFGLLQSACMPFANPARAEQANLNWKEYFKGNFRLMTDEEKAATVARLQRSHELKTGQTLNISTASAQPDVLYGYAFNISKCRGYMDCIRGCLQENNQDRESDMRYIRIHEHQKGQMSFDEASDDFFHEVPAADHFYIGTQCFQCENPPCVHVCPVKATWKEPDGIVVVDYDWCIGCRYCLAACPYDARRFNWADPVIPEEEINRNQHYLGNRLRKKGVTEKCTFCIQRTRQGQNPACVEACPTGARIFGNLLDPNSDIRWVLKHKKVFRLKEDLGTEPKFWYFMD